MCGRQLGSLAPVAGKEVGSWISVCCVKRLRSSPSPSPSSSNPGSKRKYCSGGHKEMLSILAPSHLSPNAGERAAGSLSANEYSWQKPNKNLEI